ncbi:8-oxo-dGTP diphosphatase [Sulfurisphaera javensis]|uniref:8-oxo-dGTP diphosphatase n=1 Tax=Sulfurisphaera javensis TaxID=2049879 RepID=A0AAT9GNY8_9CREN
MKTCLVIIKKNDFFLFIRKLRGLGKGFITFPGGKIEENESEKDCAVRETKEEIGIKIVELIQVAKIDFYLEDKLAEEMTVFISSKFEGIPTETDEAIPMWLNYVPYEEMWEDDRIWLPLVLEEKKIYCKFTFSDNWKKFLGGNCNLCEFT